MADELLKKFLKDVETSAKTCSYEFNSRFSWIGALAEDNGDTRRVGCTWSGYSDMLQDCLANLLAKIMVNSDLPIEWIDEIAEAAKNFAEEMKEDKTK